MYEKYLEGTYRAMVIKSWGLVLSKKRLNLGPLVKFLSRVP